MQNAKCKIEAQYCVEAHQKKPWLILAFVGIITVIVLFVNFLA